jgi:hypothetical protein
MNIIQAIQSGKPFRRKGWEVYFPLAGDLSFYGHDILATDWEVQEQKIEITKSQLWKAWDEVAGLPRAESCHSLRQLETALGFTENK